MGSYAGIDWASEKHDVLIADERGERVLAETFVHDEQGITALCDALIRFDVEIVEASPGVYCRLEPPRSAIASQLGSPPYRPIVFGPRRHRRAFPRPSIVVAREE